MAASRSRGGGAHAAASTSIDGGELAPTLAALAALADSPSTVLTGIGHLRGHETDRLAALVAEINGLGGDVTETDDGLVIAPAPLCTAAPGTATKTTAWRPRARSSASRCRASRSTTSRRPRRPCPSSPSCGPSMLAEPHAATVDA